MTTLRIGVDVGGTNTDAIAVDGEHVLATVKQPTSDDVLSGLIAAVKQLVESDGVDAGEIDAVMIGTTQFTNAVVEAKELASTGVVRMCGPATRAIPPMLDWPDRLRDKIAGPVFLVSGGHEFNGREISPIDPVELRRVIRTLEQSGVTNIAVSSVFSPVTAEHERRTVALLKESIPSLTVSSSYEIGRIG
ncbi:MAG: hydantoinase/oxoprolinase N-terminal domain-containing protein, partial [Acidimicrobiia bacterium]